MRARMGAAGVANEEIRIVREAVEQDVLRAGLRDAGLEEALRQAALLVEPIGEAWAAEPDDHDEPGHDEGRARKVVAPEQDEIGDQEHDVDRRRRLHDRHDVEKRGVAPGAAVQREEREHGGRERREAADHRPDLPGMGEGVGVEGQRQRQGDGERRDEDVMHDAERAERAARKLEAGRTRHDSQSFFETGPRAPFRRCAEAPSPLGQKAIRRRACAGGRIVPTLL